ncbi:MAG: heparinase II/III family protein [Cyclobacteriaceae bacterium]|nr:heparinase II/III family protein [Cyclobacteriaceae bacterium]
MNNSLQLAKLYYYTIRNLTFRQIYYQLYYRVKRLIGNKVTYNKTDLVNVQALSLISSLSGENSYEGTHQFTFLNKKKVYEHNIDWNFNGYGKLWTYNLNYFDFLHQERISKNEALSLLDKFCEKPDEIKVGVEPYPISLRGINWIKFFALNKIDNPVYSKVLKSHYFNLYQNLEFHLLGNHILENAFSLLFGSFYFREDKFFLTAITILKEELAEQILEDGAHFELSPMYHQILLFRLLDCINLVKNNPWKNDGLIDVLESTAIRMIGWLKHVTFKNGDIPMVNDSAFGIAPSTTSLLEYASRLGIHSCKIELSDSGYRMVRTDKYELFLDVGNIGPDYIPGHAHSDTFNFLLHVDGEPVIVDVGTSTYDVCFRRYQERSTISHNTIQINDLEQSEVWSSFRVGKRAKVIELSEKDNSIRGEHNGYSSIGLIHSREWEWSNNEINIMDELISKKFDIKAKARIHFHPDVDIIIAKNYIDLSGIRIEFDGSYELKQFDYEFASGFNRCLKAKGVLIVFSKSLKTRIIIK